MKRTAGLCDFQHSTGHLGNDLYIGNGAASRPAITLASLPSEMNDYKRTDQFADSAIDYLNQY
ncbi:MAG: hypothetical protein ACQ9MH_13200 [Nitrospinales bacterium]